MLNSRFANSDIEEYRAYDVHIREEVRQGPVPYWKKNIDGYKQVDNPALEEHRRDEAEAGFYYGKRWAGYVDGQLVARSWAKSIAVAETENWLEENGYIRRLPVIDIVFFRVRRVRLQATRVLGAAHWKDEWGVNHQALRYESSRSNGGTEIVSVSWSGSQASAPSIQFPLSIPEGIEWGQSSDCAPYAELPSHLWGAPAFS